MIVYLAGGMRSGWQKLFINSFPHITFIDPSSHGLTNPADYTKWDMEGIQKADFIIAYLESSNPSGLGLALEIGYALGLGKPVLFINQKQDRYTDMLKHASTFYSTSLDDVISRLSKM